MVGVRVAEVDAAGFLQAYHGAPVRDLELLRGGFWSVAYGYRVGTQELVVRYDRRDGEIGPARSVPSAWYPPGADASSSTWRQWVLDGLVDDPARPVHGWRRLLAEDRSLDARFEACAARVRHLVEACPERRDLVHGDLLHKNVLLADDLGAVSAVFSWKCSVLGDFLFDVAWCTFWSPWYAGIAAIDVWPRTLAAADLGARDRVDSPLRHHCYELLIGATHLGWSAWANDTDALVAVARRIEHVIERGPLDPDASPA